MGLSSTHDDGHQWTAAEGLKILSFPARKFVKGKEDAREKEYGTNKKVRNEDGNNTRNGGFAVLSAVTGA
jgi:hypothetical protein